MSEIRLWPGSEAAGEEMARQRARIAQLKAALRGLLAASPVCGMSECCNAASCEHADGYNLCEECREPGDDVVRDWGPARRAALAALGDGGG